MLTRRQDDMFTVLDELIGPLNGHISALLAQPVTGSDDQLAHVDTKRAYIALLNGIMSSKLHTVLISERKFVFMKVFPCIVYSTRFCRQ
jgi:exportin-T